MDATLHLLQVCLGALAPQKHGCEEGGARRRKSRAAARLVTWGLQISQLCAANPRDKPRLFKKTI